MLRGDGGWFTIPPPSRPEARSRFGSQTVNELGAPVASSIPEQLPGHQPASARKGYVGRPSSRSAHCAGRLIATALIDLVASRLALRAPALRAASALTRPDQSAI